MKKKEEEKKDLQIRKCTFLIIISRSGVTFYNISIFYIFFKTLSS